MIVDCEIRLALSSDAPAIAAMSRDFVEHGLSWNWTTRRVLNSLRDTATNIAVACERGSLAGFGVMHYADDEAHLNLLAVQPSHRRKGIGKAIMSWLETSALTAGIGAIYLEARVNNMQARDFYKKLGYVEIARSSGYYSGREDAVRIAKDLWK